MRSTIHYLKHKTDRIEKRCVGCGKIKKMEDFERTGTVTKYGSPCRLVHCKDCRPAHLKRLRKIKMRWRENNRENVRAANRKAEEKQRGELTDTYIKGRIHRMTGLVNAEIAPEMVALKRELLKDIREKCLIKEELNGLIRSGNQGIEAGTEKARILGYGQGGEIENEVGDLFADD